MLRKFLSLFRPKVDVSGPSDPVYLMRRYLSLPPHKQAERKEHYFALLREMLR